MKWSRTLLGPPGCKSFLCPPFLVYRKYASLQPSWPSLSSKGQIQTIANQGREGMQKQRRSSQETIAQLWVRVLVPPQGIYITIFLSSLAELTPLPRMVATSGWAWDSWSIALLPHHQPIGRKSHTLQPSPKILPVKTFPKNHQRVRGFFEYKPPVLLAWPCNKPFSAPNSSVLVCLASPCDGHTNVHSVTEGSRTPWC